jgi:hypothetical protein
LNVREHPALIPKPSAHLQPSPPNQGTTESPPLRSSEVFPQTARSKNPSIATSPQKKKH